MRLIHHLFTSTQKILHHARMAEAGVITRDPIRESIGLELDMINILYVLHSYLPTSFWVLTAVD
jgi:hypothetical protein